MDVTHLQICQKDDVALGVDGRYFLSKLFEYADFDAIVWCYLLRQAKVKEGEGEHFFYHG